jgi:hypothetical protein
MGKREVMVVKGLWFGKEFLVVEKKKRRGK